jgi:integrase
MYHDAGCRGLYLQVTSAAAGGVNRSWILRYMLDGRPRKMGLGPADLVSLAEARDRATQARKLARVDAIDPIEQRRTERAAKRAEAARAMTFAECCERYIAAHQAGWSNERHRQQWPETLEAYAYPVMGDLPVSSIDTPIVMKVIEPLWNTKQETAARLRARIERVLSWATVRGLRSGENPARWRGHIDQLLAQRNKARTTRHLPAMSYGEIPAFMRELREREGIAERALELCILTAARTGEVLHAPWSEFDLAEKAWTIPAARMKSGSEHRVPLSERAVAILAKLPRKGAHLFEGHRAHMTMLKALHRMGRRDLTVHGFRSSFRTWAGERTAFPPDLAEAALAHVIGSKTERSYNRGTLFEKRRKLMEAWASYCSKAPADDVVPPPGNVLPIGKARAHA